MPKRKYAPEFRAEAVKLVERRVAHARGRGFYGPKKLRDELLDDGLDVGINRIRRLRKKRFRTTTQSRHLYPVAPNLLGQCFTSTRPGEVWVADITYVDTGEGWLYVAGVKDLFTKELVGWAIDTRLTASLALDGLDMACTRKQPDGGLIHHSDRGSQEVFYNRQRRHASIGNLSPAEFERRYHATQMAA